MTTEYSIQKMVSDGTLSTIALGIQYLQRNDIYMRIAGEETPQSGASSGYTWSFVDNTTIKILPVVPNGVEVVVYRRTDADSMYNVYSQNAQFDEATIDENNTQLLFLSQEYLEQGSGIEAVEYLRSEGNVHYYRLQLYGGRYTDEFTITTQLPPGYERGVGDFVTGFTVMPGMRNVAWLNPAPSGDNNLYSWSGEVPPSGKIVPPNSTPETTGGFVNAWVPRTDETLRSDLAGVGGAGLIGAQLSVPGSVYRTQVDKNADFISVKDFGALGNNVADDTQAFLDAIAYCVANRRTVYVPIGKYRTSSELEFSDDVSIICEPGVVFQNTNTSNKTFPCVTISGGAKRAVLGTIDGYKEGIVVKRNTKNILFNVISNCTSGVVLRAESVGGTNLNTLDNIITGTQIGLCENGVVFEQNARLTQQGNEVHVNFCSGTKHCVVWDDLGTHTQSSNWDSNFVEFQAIDPFHIPGASICYNKTSYSVLANTVNVVKWAGGWAGATEMSLLRGGNFDACEFNFSLAQSLTPDMVCEPSQRAAFGNCQARSTRHGNTATATPPVCVGQENISTFNGGVPLHQGVFKVRVAAPELAPGAQYIAYFTHAFCVSANSSKFAVRQVRAGGNGVFVQLRDSAPTALGAVRVIVINPTGTTMTSGNIDIVITCVG